VAAEGCTIERRTHQQCTLHGAGHGASGKNGGLMALFGARSGRCAPERTDLYTAHRSVARARVACRPCAAHASSGPSRSRTAAAQCCSAGWWLACLQRLIAAHPCMIAIATLYNMYGFYVCLLLLCFSAQNSKLKKKDSSIGHRTTHNDALELEGLLVARGGRHTQDTGRRKNMRKRRRRQEGQ
jgi:hypothetical protein